MYFTIELDFGNVVPNSIIPTLAPYVRPIIVRASWMWNKFKKNIIIVIK